MITNPEKVLWPAAGFTKADMVEYYRAVAPAILPHLRDRPLTLRPFPDGVEGPNWFQENCRGPVWLRTFESRGFRHCVVDDVDALLCVANRASIELHSYLWRVDVPERPVEILFDLDPGEGAGLLECRDVALLVRDAVDRESFAKTSGALGLHVHVPLGETWTFAETKAFARGLAETLAAQHPQRIVATTQRARRAGKVLIDWLQNDATRTTVAPYSLRAMPFPTVATPVAWHELEQARREEDLVFTAADVLAREIPARG